MWVRGVHILCFIATLVSVITATMNLCAQNKNWIDSANDLFAIGKYDDAIFICKNAINAEVNSELKITYKNRLSFFVKLREDFQKAETEYNNKRYADAKESLNKLQKLNPKDENIAYLLRKIDNETTKKPTSSATSTTTYASNKELDALVRNNDIGGLKKYVKRYPKSKDIKVISQAIEYFTTAEDVKRLTEPQKASYFNTLGALYYGKNNEVAAALFEKEAETGALSGFYNLAISLPGISEDREMRLLAFAAANGLKSAKELLKRKKYDVQIDEQQAKAIYETLCKSDYRSLIATQKSKFYIGLDSLDVVSDIGAYVAETDLLYELGMLYKEGKYVKNELYKAYGYFREAAICGSIEAQLEFAKYLKSPAQDAVYLCSAVNGSIVAQRALKISANSMQLIYLKSYINFIKGEKYDSFYIWDLMINSSIMSQFRDYDATLIAIATEDWGSYRVQWNMFKKILSKRDVVDTQTIKTIQDNIRLKSDRYHLKVKKWLSKVKTRDNIRRISEFEKFVKQGMCDTPHSTPRIKVDDFLIQEEN